MSKILSLTVCLAFLTVQMDARVARAGGGGQVAVGNRSANVNHNANVNRNANVNVNRNANVNVNRNVNVNVHGGYYGGCCYHDEPGWGAVAAGVAVGAVTGAVVGAAVASSHTTTVVVAAPAIGSIAGVLPASCGVISTPAGAVYNCSNVYYRPYYQGTNLVYQVVQYP